MVNNINGVSNSYSNILSELDSLNNAIESKDLNNSIKIYNSIRLHANNLTLNAIERSEINTKGLEAYKKIMQLKNNTEPNKSNNKNRLSNIIQNSSNRNIAIGIIFVMLCGIMIVGLSSPTLIQNITSLFNNAGTIILPNQEIPGTINKTNNSENNTNITNNISNQSNNNLNISNNNNITNQSNISTHINNSNITYGSSGGSGGGGGGGVSEGDDESDDLIDTCTDGIQNENETGIDCGGNCIACPKYLVENNTGYAEIIISQTAPNMVEIAADELQTHIYNMTGALIPINTIKNESILYHIYVGQSNYTDELGITDEGCEFDSFKMIAGEDYLVLLGNDTEMNTAEPYTHRWNEEIPMVREAWDNITEQTWDNPYILYYKSYNPTYDIWEQDGKGSLNAVYEFLYEQGIRWYYPGTIGTIMPLKENITLPTISKTITPDFDVRQMFFYYKQYVDIDEDELKWQLRLRLNTGEESIGIIRGHGTNQVTSRSEVKSAHPEYYAIWNGVLMNNSDQKQDLCSAGLLAENIEFVKAIFDHYDDPTVHVGPADGYTQISESSQECIDKATPERGYEGKLSDYVWEYINNVAMSIYNTHPNKKILGPAYTTYLLPPEDINELSPNVVVFISRWRSSFSNSSTKEFYQNLTNNWLDKLPSNETYTYDYYLHNQPDRDYVGIPIYFPHIISDDLKFLKGKSKGENIEVSTTYSGWNLNYDTMAANSLNVYITARLYWNSSEDIDELLDEYYELYYGPASAEMKELIEYSESNLDNALTDPNVLLTLRAMGNDAKAVAGDTIYGQRIDILLKFMNATYIGEEVSISSCQNLTSPSTKYKLTSDVSSTGTCFNIQTLNVTIDCEGHKINYSTAGLANTQGIYSTYDHSNIIDCIIVDGNPSSANSGRSGIYFNGLNNGLIQNNTINTSSNSAIIMLGSTNILLQSNKAYVDSGVGIYSYSSTDLKLENNSAISNSYYGIYMYGSDNSILNNNNGTSNSSYGIYISSSSNVTLKENNGTSYSSRGIYLYNALNSNLSYNNGTSTTGSGIYVYGNSSTSILTNNIARSVTSNGIYIYLNSENITLIENTAISNSSRGIMIESSNNIITGNNGISTANSGIYIQNSNNILNNNKGTTNSNAAISIQGAYNTLNNNTGISNTSAGIEIYSDYNNITSNIGQSNTSSGIFLSSSSNNVLTNNIGTSNISYGIYIYNSNNNILINQTAIGINSGSRAISLLNTNNSIFVNCFNITGVSNDVYTLSSTNNTLINCSYNISKESITGANNYVTRKWYFKPIIVDNLNQTISNANITLYNITGHIIYSNLTNSEGTINIINITEYINTEGVRRYSTPHIINVTKTGYTINSTTYNITVTRNILSSITLI